MDQLTLISAAVFIAAFLLISLTYLLNSKQFKIKSIQAIARKLGLFSIIAILFESVLMDHFYVIHVLALINAVALWVFGLLEDVKDSAASDEQVSGG